MKYYFQLQFNRILRIIKDFGLSPIFVFIFGSVAFVFSSAYLFQKEVAVIYFYPLIAVAIAANLSNKKRIDFLKLCFNDKEFYKVRIVENLICALPFVAFLVYKQHFIIAIAMLLIISLQALIFSFKNRNSIIIPTPFFKKPFEFIVGFRKVWYYFIAIYFVLFKAIQVQNPNLGIFVLLVNSLISISFYFNMEDKFYVWIYNKSPKEFLLEKIKNAMLQSTILNLPMLVLLIFCFPQMWYFYALIFILAYFYLALSIVGKYAYYPSEISFVQILALLICFIFPPFLLIVFPYFYSLAIKKLSYILK